MKTNDWNDFGEQIRQAVDSAVHSGDFQDLSRSIGDIVNTTIDSVKSNIKENISYSQGTSTSGRTRAAQTQSAPVLYEKRPQGRAAGILLIVFGFLIFAVFLILALSFGIVGLFGLHSFLTAVLVFSALALLGLGMGIRGIRKLGYLSRFTGYVRSINGHMYAPLQSLADKTGKSLAYTVRDLQKMIADRLFYEAHLDTDSGYLILSDQAYSDYMTQKAAYTDRQQKQQKAQKTGREESASLPEECRKIIADGEAYIRHIHTCNDLIPDAEITAKLDKMEQVVSRIFAELRRHPELAPDLQKMMNYYLPTTAKLLDAYRDLDAQPIEGENISATKHEIEASIDTLNIAFEKLLDSLFTDRAWDISSDISVLNTVLAQDGLTESDFSKKE